MDSSVEPLIPKVVGITGHRKLSAKDRVTVRSAMKALLLNPSVDEIWFGGAIGTDTECLKAALEFRIGRRPKLVVVLPDTLTQQPAETHAWTRRADSVIELKRKITSDDRYQSYRDRNEFIVNHSAVLVGFWNNNPKSGTGSAVNYAKKTNCKVKTIKIDGE